MGVCSLRLSARVHSNVGPSPIRREALREELAQRRKCRTLIYLVIPKGHGAGRPGVGSLEGSKDGPPQELVYVSRIEEK